MNLTVHQWAAIAIGLMAGLIAVMDWVPTPLNRNIQGMSVRERWPGTIIHSGLGAVFGIANVLALKWTILAGAVWYSVVLLAAVRNWWIPYLAGIHWGEITPEIYSRYTRNLVVLPQLRGNPVIPDLQHMLIHLTILVASVLSWYSFSAA